MHVNWKPTCICQACNMPSLVTNLVQIYYDKLLSKHRYMCKNLGTIVQCLDMFIYLKPISELALEWSFSKLQLHQFLSCL